MTEDEEIKVSWTKLRIWSECKQKAYLSRSKYGNPTQDTRNFFPGTVSDRIMRTWLEDPDRQPGQMATWVEDYVDRYSDVNDPDSDSGIVRWRNRGDRQVVIDFCKTLCKDLEIFLDNYVLPFEFWPAERFSVPIQVPGLDGEPRIISLIGEFDLLVKDGDSYSVYDLKATKDKNYYKKSYGQLVFYDLAVLAKYGVPTREVGIIQPMCQDQLKIFTVDAAERRDTLSLITRYCESVWRGDYAPKEGISECGMCSRNHACSRYKSYPDAKGHSKVPLLLGMPSGPRSGN